jgi:hypothetical protein
MHMSQIRAQPLFDWVLMRLKSSRIFREPFSKSGGIVPKQRLGGFGALCDCVAFGERFHDETILGECRNEQY